MFTVAYLLARAAFGSRGLPGWHSQVMGWVVGREGGWDFWAPMSLSGQRGVQGTASNGEHTG